MNRSTLLIRFSARNRRIRKAILEPVFVLTFALMVAAVAPQSHAATLSEDRADALFHSYDGGGVTISGPSILVRKDYKEKVSVYANYYVDMISSASIDVITQGSKYSEERTEMSLGMDYLYQKATLSFGATNSSESDYEAKTGHIGISQAFFGDLTTLSMGYAHGEDDVYENNYENRVRIGREFRGNAKHRRFNLSATQILTKNWIVALTTESVIDDGFLRNPYRHYRYAEGGVSILRKESYPTTRNSDAFALRSMYLLPNQASVRIEGRVYSDTWGIDAHNLEVRYAHPYQERFIFEVKARVYSQSQADFYSDMFAGKDSLEGETGAEFRARDKELSKFSSFNLGFGVTYDLQKQWRFINKQSVSLFFDAMRFDYVNFRDASLSKAQNAPFLPGEEPAYTLNANILRLFYSAYY